MKVSNVYMETCTYLLPLSNVMKSINSANVGIKYEIEASEEIKMQCKQRMKWNLDGGNK